MKSTIIFSLIILTLIFSVSAKDLTVTSGDKELSSSGFVYIYPSVLESTCVIPDHNSGNWGCEEKIISLWQTVGHVTEVVITNLSDPSLSSMVLRDLGRDEMAEVFIIDIRDNFLTYGLKVVDGKNTLDIVVYEDTKVIWKGELVLHVTLSNGF